MSNLHTLPGITIEPRGDDPRPSAVVVEELETLLERARHGDIQAFAMTYVRPGSRVCTKWVPAEGVSSHLLVAGASFLQWELCQACVCAAPCETPKAG